MPGTVYRLNGRTLTEEEWQEHKRTRCQGRLEEMLAAGRPPHANTDREFLKGHCNGSQFDGMESRGDFYRRVAEAHGQDVKGKVYLASLARFPGDPQAWVSGKGDVEKVLDANGWGSEGLVKREVRNVAQPASVAVAPDIVQEDTLELAEQLAGEEAGQVDHVDLAEQVFNARKGTRSKETFRPEIHCPDFVQGDES